MIQKLDSSSKCCWYYKRESQNASTSPSGSLATSNERFLADSRPKHSTES